jgi:hypothetical protein
LDVTGNHTTVLKGSYSQYYEGIFNDVYKLATPGYQDRISWDMTGCPSYGPSGPTASYRCPLSARTEVNRLSQPLGRIDPDIKHPRVEEFALGFERAIGRSVRVAVTGIYRKNENFIGNVLPDARWTPRTVSSTATAGFPSRSIGVYTWANRTASRNSVLITNPDGFRYLDPSGNVVGTLDAYRKYRALMVNLSKAYSNRWRGQVSYVYSRSEGTINNGSEALFGPSRFYETPTLALVNADGRSLNDRPHELKTMLGYEIPGAEISVNAYYRFLSGRTYTPFQRFASSQVNFSVTAYYFGFSSGRQPNLEARGSRRLPTEHILDVRLEKIFRVGSRNDRIAVYADFLNLTNRGTVLARLNRVPSTTLFLPPPAEPGTTQAVPFEAPSLIEQPRRVILGARWSF